MQTNKFFLLFIGVYFSAQAVFHFVRLAFNWEVHVYEVFFFPYWGSALYFIFSVFIVYLLLRSRGKVGKVKKNDKNDSISEEDDS